MENRRPHPVFWVLCVAWAAGLAACAPDDVRMELLVYSRTADSYDFRVVELTTLTDLDAMKGDVTELLAGAAVSLDYRDGMLRWNEPPRTVAFAWHLEGDRVVPQDYKSFAMASVYYNIEQAALFFEGLGLPEDVVGRLPTYFDPVFNVIQENGEKQTWRDNAFFVALTHDENAFFVLPFEQFEWVPLPLNLGIMCHEYTHAVFNELVYDANPVLGGQIPEITINFLSSINEGLADFMAVTLTGDPDFITHSVPLGVFSVEGNYGPVEIVRDASQVLPYTAAMDTAAKTRSTDAYDPYAIGSFLSAYFYAVAGALEGLEPGEAPSMNGLERVAKDALNTMGDIGDQAGSSFDLADALTLFVSRYKVDSERSVVCEILLQRASLLVDSVDGC